MQARYKLRSRSGEKEQRESSQRSQGETDGTGTNVRTSRDDEDNRADQETEHRRASAAQNDCKNSQGGCDQCGDFRPPCLLQQLQSDAEERDDHEPGSEIISMAEGSGRSNDGKGTLSGLIGFDRQQRIPAEVLRDSVKRGKCASGCSGPQKRPDVSSISCGPCAGE